MKTPSAPRNSSKSANKRTYPEKSKVLVERISPTLIRTTRPGTEVEGVLGTVEISHISSNSQIKVSYILILPVYVQLPNVNVILQNCHPACAIIRDDIGLTEEELRLINSRDLNQLLRDVGASKATIKKVRSDRRQMRCRYVYSMCSYLDKCY